MVDSDESNEEGTKSPTSSPTVPSNRAVLDDDDEEVETTSPPSTPAKDDGSKAELGKRKAVVLQKDTPKRSRQHHEESDGMLVNNDLAHHKEFDNSLDDIFRVAKKLAADLEAVSRLANSLVANMTRRES